MPGPFRPGPRGLQPTAGPLDLDTFPVVLSVTPNSGRTAGGTSVTITGRNFRNSASGAAPIVKFGTLTATSVVAVSQTSITCNTPVSSSVGLVDLSVQCDSQVGVLQGAFTYYTGTIASLSPAFGTFNGGTAVTITGYNFVTGSTILFGGSSATDITFIDDGHFSVVTPNHAVGVVDVVITEPGGAVATLRNGFQFTLLNRGADIRRQPGITVQDSLNNQPNQCPFVIDGQSNVPRIGEEIEITDSFDGNRLLFRGSVQSYEQVYEELTNQLAWHASAIDFTWLLNKYRPFGSFRNTCVSDIVKWMVSNFAPGFTSDFVQSNLAKVSIDFDGSQDFVTCLNNLAQAIGGGHWYADYNQAVHFFHTIPPGIILPALPQTVMRLGPGTAMTVAEGAGIPSTFGFDVGFYIFWSTFVYDNGVESALSPSSNCLALQGTNQIVFTNIPIGAAAGTHNVTKRRLYYTFIGPSRLRNPIIPLAQFCEIPDNTTTGFTTWFGPTGSTVATIIAIATTTLLPRFPSVAPPAAPAVGPTAVQGSAAIFYPQSPQFILHVTQSFTRGPWAFKVSGIYRDGTESLPSPASRTVILDGVSSVSLTNIPTFSTINGVDCVARKVYGAIGSAATKSLSQVIAELNASKTKGTLKTDFGPIIGYSDAAALQNTSSIPTTYNALALIIGFNDLDALLNPATDPDWSPDRAGMWYLLPDNTTLSQNIGPGTGGPQVQPPTNPNDTSEPVPMWPNPDGPTLENFATPDDINNSNTSLLRDTPFLMRVDGSQVRNRVYIRGAGTSLTAAAIPSGTTLAVADVSMFSRNGGTLIAGFQQREYTALNVIAGPGTITLRTPLTNPIDAGAPVNLWLQADNLDSQKTLGAAELDKNGRPTDGIHEYTIVDTSLRTPFQLYMRAYAELELFALPITSIRYATRDPKSRSGATVHVDLTNPPCFGDFLIQDVTIDQIHDESDQLAPRYGVSASSVRFELSDLLLQLVANLSPSSATGIGISPAGLVETAVVQVQASGARSSARFTLAHSQIQTLFSVPLIILPSPGEGKFIHILYGWIHSQFPTTGYTSAQTVVLRYGKTPTGGGIGQNNILPFSSAITNTIGYNRYIRSLSIAAVEEFFDYSIPAPSGAGTPVNKPVYITIDTLGADPAGGAADNTLVCYIVYEILDDLVNGLQLQ